MIPSFDYSLNEYLSVLHAAKNLMNEDYNTWTHLSRDQVVDILHERVNKPNYRHTKDFIGVAIDSIIEDVNQRNSRR